MTKTDITHRCFFRPRIYNKILQVNIFFGDEYVGSLKEGGRIDQETARSKFKIIEHHGLFKVFKEE